MTPSKLNSADIPQKGEYRSKVFPLYKDLNMPLDAQELLFRQLEALKQQLEKNIEVQQAIALHLERLEKDKVSWRQLWTVILAAAATTGWAIDQLKDWVWK